VSVPNSRATYTARRFVSRLETWLVPLAIALLSSLLLAPVRNLVWPPTVEWAVLGTEGPAINTERSAFTKTYRISYELVDPADTGSHRTVRVDTPVCMLPVRFTARRGNVHIVSCEFVQGDRMSDHLEGVPTFLRVPGDAIPEEELDEILQAYLAHDLSTKAADPHFRVSMADMRRHLNRYRELLARRTKIPVILHEDEPMSFMLIIVPRLYTGERDRLAGADALSDDTRLDLFAAQQKAVQRLNGEDWLVTLTTSTGQRIELPAHFERRISPGP
jgi:hypothetical protein